MSVQLMELLFFAGIAFFVINKLISVLGTTSDEDITKKRQTFYGEPNAIKDVTPEDSSKSMDINLNAIKQYVVLENLEDIKSSLVNVLSMMPTFECAKFIHGASSAFNMLVQAKPDDQDLLASLVDKRYLDRFISSIPDYQSISIKDKTIEAKISELYTFGNNIFVKVLFHDTIGKGKSFNEEWTFSKRADSGKNDWLLNNVDR